MNDLNTPISMVRPPLIEFGPGTISRLAGWIRARSLRKALVVADAFNARRVETLQLGIETVVFGEVRPEPDLPNLEALIELADRSSADLIIGFGGGSAMDLAKLVSVMTGTGQRLGNIVGVGKTGKRKVALAQVPTTSGTGSEAGTRALVTDPATQAKLAVESMEMLADIAVIDPALTVTVPPSVTAATGVDAMAHCVEAYTSKKAHPLIDLYALEGIRLVGRYLSRAVRDGNDIEARSGLSLASLYGGFCLGPVNTAGGHALAYPLGTRWHIAHGAANALIFPHVLAFNVPVAGDRTARIVEALGLGGAANSEEVLKSTYDYCGSLGIEMRLSKLGVPEVDLGVMADDAYTIRRLLDNNPRDLTRGDILSIYQAAY